MRKFKHRHRLLWAAPALLALCGFIWWSNNSLMTDQARFFSPRLPDSFDGFTIVQLSDLQSEEFGTDNRTLLSAVEAAHPDLIAMTGDLVDQYRTTPHGYVTALGTALSAIAPTYFVTGNHEWARGGVPALKQELSAAGVTVLSNQYVTLEREGASIVLAGIDDPNGYADQKTPEELTAGLYADLGHPFWILLAHRNDYFASQYSLLGADLVLSGHAHGGIIRLPFTDGLLGHDGMLFPSYTAGFYQANGSTLFVSRGLGNSGPALRLFNRPEVAVITLRKS